jgi:hypothetical protein
MGKKKYSQEDFRKLIFDKLYDLRHAYLDSKNNLSLEIIHEDLRQVFLEMTDPALEPLTRQEFEIEENRFITAFQDSNSEFERFPPIQIDSANFIRMIKDNDTKKYLYIYFLSTNSSPIGLGLRFSNITGLKNDLTTVYGDNFYILNAGQFAKENQNTFKAAVDNFHSSFDQIIKKFTHTNEVTLYICDFVADALNVIKINPDTVKMNLMLDQNQKLCLGTITDTNGNELFFNRGQLWP